MQLSELVKNYSINTVSQKTNISVEVLEKLINREWGNLQKAKVNGFLQIIEREFSIDLSDIREEAKGYYAEHKVEQPHRPIDLVDAQVEGGSAKRVVANLLTITVLGLISYAGWFYLAKGNNNLTTEDNNSKGMFRDSIDAAKKLIGVVDKNKTQVIKSVEKKEDTTKLTQEKIIEKKSEEKTVEPKSIEANNTKEENTTQRVIKKFDITTPTQEQNNSETQVETNLEENTTKTEPVDLTNTQKSETITKQTQESTQSNNTTQENETNATEQNQTQDNNETITQATQEDTNISNETTDKNSSNSEGIDVKLDENITTNENNLSANVANKITITPTVKKIWIGIYNLKTKKRVAKVATRAYKYSTNGGDVAIVTGHSKFKITTDTGASNQFNNAKKKKYLLISKDGIKVLTKREYKKVTKRRAW